MKKILKIICLFGVIFYFSTSLLNAQTLTIPCPSGDDYICYTMNSPDGSSVSVRKGGGNTTIIIKK
jgi:hypothetical protein